MEHLVLRLLVEHGSANGQRLCELDETITPGSVYKILERLRDREFVECKREVASRRGVIHRVRGTRQPSFYKPTAKGKRALERNDTGSWHVQKWIDWCEHVGIDPVRSWRGEPGKRYLEQRSSRGNPWQIHEAVEQWVNDQRAARAS